jgi:hypothetical protein
MDIVELCLIEQAHAEAAATRMADVGVAFHEASFRVRWIVVSGRNPFIGPLSMIVPVRALA